MVAEIFGVFVSADRNEDLSDGETTSVKALSLSNVRLT